MARLSALQRFVAKCQFDPATGCVLWVGGKCYGRGKNIRYGIFRGGEAPVEGKHPAPWLAHRWSAHHIHGFDIDGFQVDHWCPNIPIPNTLCVEHVRPETPERNRHLQTERRRHFVHLQVGLLPYEEIYGPLPSGSTDDIPFYSEPDWLIKARLSYEQGELRSRENPNTARGKPRLPLAGLQSNGGAGCVGLQTTLVSPASIASDEDLAPF